MYKDFEKRLWNDFDSQKSKFVFIITLPPQNKPSTLMCKNWKKCYYGNLKNQESRKIIFYDTS